MQRDGQSVRQWINRRTVISRRLTGFMISTSLIATRMDDKTLLTSYASYDIYQDHSTRGRDLCFHALGNCARLRACEFVWMCVFWRTPIKHVYVTAVF